MLINVLIWNGTFHLKKAGTTTMDYILEEVQEITISKVIKWVSSTVMIFGGVAPFIPQYREIKKKNDAEGFSLYVCLVLLIANTLRILFWFGKRYELPLLAQSMIMNVMMLLMIHLCVRVKNRGQIIRGPDRVFTDNCMQILVNIFGMFVSLPKLRISTVFSITHSINLLV
ncbi:solute carrier family 66 member 2 isoform X6 [Rhodnius prolixus]|uniref:solute carrier family 66 member 2 isoform X6 n=1 Tax=Rhodnius prolixus TaxID=13249 RepID=UPI003D18E0CA